MFAVLISQISMCVLDFAEHFSAPSSNRDPIYLQLLPHMPFIGIQADEHVPFLSFYPWQHMHVQNFEIQNSSCSLYSIQVKPGKRFSL